MSLEFNIKIKKLKLAKKLAFTKSKRENLKKEAEELSSELDEKIQSIAINKFAVAKVKRLKSLGKNKEEINELIAEISAAEPSLLDKASNKISSFFIDEEYEDLEADEVLEKIGVPLKKTQDEKIPELMGPPRPELMGPPRPEEVPASVQRDLPSYTSEMLTDDEKLNIKFNSDVDTPEKIQENNEKIYDYLVKSGETGAAAYIMNMLKPKDTKFDERISEIQKNTDEVKSLSVTNRKITDILDEIQKSFADKQEHSVDPIEKKLQEQVLIKNEESVPKKDEKKTAGFFESILRLLFGDTITNLLMMAKDVGALALSLLKTGSSFILNTIKNTFSKLIAPFSKAFDMIKSVVSKIPGIGSFFSEKDIPDLNTKKDIDSPKKISTNNTEVDAKKIDAEVKKQVALDANDAPNKGKVDKLSDAKMQPKGGKGGILKKLLRFTKPIPLIGTAIAAGTAIYSATDGYTNASEYLQIPEEQVTVPMKLATAAGALVNDVSFGLLSTKGTAEKIINWMDSSENDDTIKKYQDELGIIEHNTFGNSEILKWDEIAKLPKKEIDRIIKLDDWSDEDKQKLEEYSKSNFNITDTTDQVEKPAKITEEQADITTEEDTEAVEEPLKIDSKVDLLNQDLGILKDELAEAENNGDSTKINNIKTAISKKESEIQDEKDNINSDPISGYTTTKFKKMYEVEGNYNSTLSSTKNYDKSNTPQVISNNSSNINSINASKQNSGTSAFELFEQ